MFKVGDRVKRIKYPEQAGFIFDLNRVYTVSKVEKSRIYVKEDKGQHQWDADRFVLAKPRGPYLSNQGTEAWY